MPAIYKDIRPYLAGFFHKNKTNVRLLNLNHISQSCRLVSDLIDICIWET